MMMNGTGLSLGDMTGMLRSPCLSDASFYRWAAVVYLKFSDISRGDYWDDEVKNKHINA